MPASRQYCVRVLGSLQVMSRTFRLLNIAWYMAIHDNLVSQHGHVRYMTISKVKFDAL